MLSPVDGGWGSIFQPNRFYDPSNGTVDFSRLRYSAEMPLWIWIPSGVAREPGFPRGGLYLDGDDNGRLTRIADYAFWVTYTTPPPGRPRKAFYTPAVTRAARDRKVFGRDWPTHIATVDEVDEHAAAEYPLPLRERRCAPVPGHAGRGGRIRSRARDSGSRSPARDRPGQRLARRRRAVGPVQPRHTLRSRGNAGESRPAACKTQQAFH